MGLSQQIINHPIIGLDTSIFIYHLERHPVYSALTHELLLKIEQGLHRACTSTITIMEISVRPIQLGKPEVARQYEALLVNFPHLEIVTIDRSITRRAAQLRAGYNIHSADALQIAACMVSGAHLYVTNDHRLSSLKSIMDIILLDDFVDNH